ncbi:kinase-like domain-containing protein [Tuber borchii]|uniref:Kinase-like domain-containing protein n=1 Tax=Tuber borchii TaxID=42251 RepID=A0A2T7A0F0_TUBBO|nr:kinase-like domain-containing protein [Tuber borchii]
MDPWPSYSTDSTANRQPRYANNVLQQNPSPQHPRDHNPPQQPPSSSMAAASGPGTTQQPYQAYQGTGPSPAQAASTTRLDSSLDYMDVQMPDADPYSRAKYQQPQSSRQPYASPEEPASQRYTGIGSNPNPQAGYSSSASTHSLPQVNYPPQMAASASSSSYQQRQSPSRLNYTSSSQSYYAQQQQPPAASPRTSAPPSMQSYQHHLQQSGSGSSGSDPNNGRYFPSSGSSVTMYDQMHTGHHQSTPREPPPRFSRVTALSDLKPQTNSQPAFRRAHPEGGFISPLQALTTHLPATYRICNPTFKYESSRNPRRVLTKPSKGVKNDGYDNEDSDYILYVNDILGSEETKNRYLILDVLGQGTFGQVVKCQNLKTQEVVAVKVVKNRTAYFNQSMMEVSVLDLLNSKLDKNDDHHILRLKDTFIHRQHLCLVFELLSVNLYELIKQNQFRGLSTTLVRVFAQQLLNALCLLNKARLIHCDLKPENILLKNLESPIIKVIDFGSACDERQTVYTYIQSRFYRSPEVLLGLPYSSSIDMWSLGCIVVELFLGLPLFPGSSEYNQVARINEMLGMPPVWMLEMGKQAGEFFEKVHDEFGRKTYQLKSMEKYSREHGTKEQPSKKYFQATTLPEIIRQYAMPRKNMKPIEMEREMNNRIAFIDFVRGLLNINPVERWSPQQAKLHPFITQQKYTGPFIPPMNLKSPPPKSPMSGAEQQQRAEQAMIQKQQAAMQAQAQAQIQAQQRVQQAQQAAHVAPSQPGYSGVSLGNFPASSGHPQPPTVYNNAYGSTQQPNQPQQQAPPAYTTSSTQYGSQLGIMQQQQQQPQQQHQGGQIPSSYGQAAHQALYSQNPNRAARQRSATMVDGVPPQIQRAASMMDPTQPIRLQPSPAYFPPPPGGIPDEPGNGRGRRQNRGGQYRSRDVIRTLEDRTLEDGLFNQQHW